MAHISWQCVLVPKRKTGHRHSQNLHPPDVGNASPTLAVRVPAKIDCGHEFHLLNK